MSSNPPTIFGPSSPGSQVDLNIIPTNLIERVENVGIGGAPTYGSDAISGVSNVILRDHFDGVEVELGYGLSERGDGQRVNASSLFGTGFAEGRGHFVLSLNYDSQDGVLQADRRSYREGYSLQTNPAAKPIAQYQPGRVAANDGRLDSRVPFNAGSSDGVPGSVYIRDRTLLGTTWGGVALPMAERYSADASGRLRGFGDNADTYVQFDGQGNLVPYDPGRNFGTGNASGGDGARLWEVSQVVSTWIARRPISPATSTSASACAASGRPLPIVRRRESSPPRASTTRPASARRGWMAAAKRTACCGSRSAILC